MKESEVYKEIEKGIEEKSELLFSVKHGLGKVIDNISFQAYILGDDTFQYSFVWGYIPGQNLYYKFMLENIISISQTTKEYNVRLDACYQYAINETHFMRLDKFKNIYGEAARHEQNESFKIKKIIVTHGGQPQVLHVAACKGLNDQSGEKGFLAYGFKANLTSTPKNIDNAKLLVDTLFESENEALREAERIMKDITKTTYMNFKKSQKK